MEFLRIGDSKIKIVLNRTELERYGISTSEDGCNSGNRRAVWEILEEAKSSVGFDPEGDKILVQFYPMKDGGCEIFVTKLGILAESSARSVIRSERVTLLSKLRRYFVFSSLCDVECAVRAVLSDELLDRKATLLGAENTYILALDEIADGYSTELAALLEFSRSATEELFLYATEHFNTLYEDVPLKLIANI